MGWCFTLHTDRPPGVHWGIKEGMIELMDARTLKKDDLRRLKVFSRLKKYFEFCTKNA
jgi:hypothetical protein